MNDYISYLKVDCERDLQHVGIKRRSGRYPYGSGERPFQGDDPKVRKKLLKDLNKSEKEARGYEAYKQQSEAVEVGDGSFYSKLYKKLYHATGNALIDSIYLKTNKKNYENSKKKIKDILDKIGDQVIAEKGYSSIPFGYDVNIYYPRKLYRYKD